MATANAARPFLPCSVGVVHGVCVIFDGLVRVAVGFVDVHVLTWVSWVWVSFANLGWADLGLGLGWTEPIYADLG